MLLRVFQRATATRIAEDSYAVDDLRHKYGAETLAVLEYRSGDRSLNGRDRRHWKRLLRRARQLESSAPL